MRSSAGCRRSSGISGWHIPVPYIDDTTTTLLLLLRLIVVLFLLRCCQISTFWSVYLVVSKLIDFLNNIFGIGRRRFKRRHPWESNKTYYPLVVLLLQ